MDQKQCNACKIIKNTSEFYRPSPAQQKRRMKITSECKKCLIQRAKRYTEKYRHTRVLKTYLKREFNITLEYYQELNERQNKACAICGIKAESARHGRLCVDHCHTTGIVRGLLCDTCNRAIGLLKDNIAICDKAAEYLRKTKCT